jgi:NDP-sugar pyrophosphorylase family protein
MKAFVLAGGLGTRLRPRFGALPKPLAPLGGQPFLTRQLRWLHAQGLRGAVVLAGYGSDQLQAAHAAAPVAGLAVEWSVEAEPLGTGGALALARARVDGPALVVNGDTLGDARAWELERARWEHGALGAVALYRVDDARARGRVECDPDGRVLRFVEKDHDFAGPAWVNGGLYAFAPGLWDALPAGTSSLERDTLPRLAAAGRLIGVRCPGRFWDIGTPEDHQRAEEELA